MNLTGDGTMVRLTHHEREFFPPQKLAPQRAIGFSKAYPIKICDKYRRAEWNSVPSVNPFKALGELYPYNSQDLQDVKKILPEAYMRNRAAEPLS